MRHFWRTAFAVTVAGFALVATLDVRPALADGEEGPVVHTLCAQGILTVCGETVEYICPAGGGISYTFPYSFGITFTQTPCYPTNRRSLYKDFISNTPPIIITAPGARCVKTPTAGTSDGSTDGSTPDAENCVDG